jgi:hypothetical protein
LRHPHVGLRTFADRYGRHVKTKQGLHLRWARVMGNTAIANAISPPATARHRKSAARQQPATARFLAAGTKPSPGAGDGGAATLPQADAGPAGIAEPADGRLPPPPCPTPTPLTGRPKTDRVDHHAGNDVRP